jgi:hypothetical protein
MSRRKNRNSISGNNSSAGGNGDCDANTPKLLPSQKLLLDKAQASIRVKSDGQDKLITILDALMQKNVQMALGGSSHAMGQIMRAIRAAEKALAKQISQDVEQGQLMRQHYALKLKNWVEAGNDSKLCVPHPDDIIIDEQTGWSAIGPVDAEDLQSTLKQCALRDALFANGVLDGRMASKAEWAAAGGDIKREPDFTGTALALLIEDTLPERFRRSTPEWVVFEMQLLAKTKRELLKHVHQSLLACGITATRGRRLPTMDYIESGLDLINSSMKAIRQADNDGQPMTVKAIAHMITPPLQTIVNAERARRKSFGAAQGEDTAIAKEARNAAHGGDVANRGDAL